MKEKKRILAILAVVLILAVFCMPMIFALGKDRVTARASEMFNKEGEYEKILNLPVAKKASAPKKQSKKKK